MSIHIFSAPLYGRKKSERKYNNVYCKGCGELIAQIDVRLQYYPTTFKNKYGKVCEFCGYEFGLIFDIHRSAFDVSSK